MNSKTRRRGQFRIRDKPPANMAFLGAAQMQAGKLEIRNPKLEGNSKETRNSKLETIPAATFHEPERRSPDRPVSLADGDMIGARVSHPQRFAWSQMRKVRESICRATRCG
jgi:hypothetical protein